MYHTYHLYTCTTCITYTHVPHVLTHVPRVHKSYVCMSHMSRMYTCPMYTHVLTCPPCVSPAPGRSLRSWWPSSARTGGRSPCWCPAPPPPPSRWPPGCSPPPGDSCHQSEVSIQASRDMYCPMRSWYSPDHSGPRPQHTGRPPDHVIVTRAVEAVPSDDIMMIILCVQGG